MATTLPVPVNPAVLLWARRESGYSAERVAKKVGVRTERIEAWERGEGSPTLRQIQNLAAFLHRPLSLFFLSSVPQVPPLAMEYRRLTGVSPGEETPQLRLAIRQMILRRESALVLMEELGERVAAFGLQAHLAESPESVGTRLREALNLTVQTQLAWTDEWQAWREWRAAAERLGILVFQFPNVELTEARGLCLLRFPMPVVGVNSKEQPESRVYTLLHELVHLMLAAAHEEASALQEKRTGPEWEALERFSEEAASFALIPENVLRLFVSANAGAWDLQAVRALARRFRVTPLAMATRLRASGYLTWPQYQNWKKEWTEFTSTLSKRKGGFAHPVDIALGRSGRPYAQLVLEALAANRITSVDASRYLGLRFEYFEKLRESLRKGPIGKGNDE